MCVCVEGCVRVVCVYVCVCGRECAKYMCSFEQCFVFHFKTNLKTF